jgi:hypothetical protein
MMTVTAQFVSLLLLFSASSSSGQRFDLSQLSLRAAAEAQAGSSDYFNCANQDTHFELVTGYVYTAPDDMLDSRPGTEFESNQRRNIQFRSKHQDNLARPFKIEAQDF